jgi:hypothetical protein
MNQFDGIGKKLVVMLIFDSIQCPYACLHHTVSVASSYCTATTGTDASNNMLNGCRGESNVCPLPVLSRGKNGSRLLVTANGLRRCMDTCSNTERIHSTPQLALEKRNENKVFSLETSALPHTDQCVSLDWLLPPPSLRLVPSLNRMVRENMNAILKVLGVFQIQHMNK